MKSIFKIIAAGSLLAALAFAPAANAATKAKDALAATAEAGRLMTINELYDIFQGRSWIWDDGAGYFDVSKRRFTAWSGYGKKASYAEGTWFLNKKGRVCFNATWYAIDGAGKAVTCFENRTDGKNMYQRRLPDGEWYVFSHIPPRGYDAIRKLKRGDYVSRKLERNKKYIEAKTADKDPCEGLDILARIICRIFH